MLKRSILFAALMVLASSQFVLAQPQPMPPDPYDANQQNPAAGPIAMAAPPPIITPAYPAVNDYPAAEVQAVPVAKARFAMARAQYSRAQNDVYQVVDQLKEDFEYSTVLQAALRGEKLAYDRYAANRDRVLKQVAAEPEHRTLKNLCSDLNERLALLKSRPGTSKDELIATAELKLVYASKLSDMESDALKADSGLQDAKARLVEATNNVSDLRGQFKRSVKRDEKFVAARKEMGDARVDKITSAAYLEGVVDARNIALDYAYWLHRYDPYTYNGNVGGSYPFLYGSGYGYGGYSRYNYGYRNTVFNPFRVQFQRTF